MESLGGARLDAAQEPARDAPAARDPRATGEGRRPGGASRSPADRLPRRMSSRLRKLPLAALAARWPCSRLGACGDSHTKVTTGTYAGESGANAPYLNVGPLIYEVQLSRELNPTNSEDADLPAGPDAREAQARSPGQEWFGVFLQVYNNDSPAARRRPRDHDQRHAGQRLHADRPRRDQPVRLPRRARAGQRPAPDARHDRRRSAPRRARCCSTRSRSSRSTTARSS